MDIFHHTMTDFVLNKKTLYKKNWCIGLCVNGYTCIDIILLSLHITHT